MLRSLFLSVLIGLLVVVSLRHFSLSFEHGLDVEIVKLNIEFPGLLTAMFGAAALMLACTALTVGLVGFYSLNAIRKDAATAAEEMVSKRSTELTADLRNRAERAIQKAADDGELEDVLARYLEKVRYRSTNGSDSDNAGDMIARAEIVLANDEYAGEDDPDDDRTRD